MVAIYMSITQVMNEISRKEVYRKRKGSGISTYRYNQDQPK